MNDSFVANLVPNEICAEETINLFGVEFTPIRLLHGRLPIVGFMVTTEVTPGSTPGIKIAYCTDVSSIPPETWPYLEDLDTLVLDMLQA